MNIQVKHQDLLAIQDRINIIKNSDLGNPVLDQIINEVNCKIDSMFINSVVSTRGLGTTRKTALEK